MTNLSKLETDIFNYKTPEFFINMKDVPPPKSELRGAFVSEEKRKCREGINVNGVYIPGELYFHLNYYYLQGDNIETGKKEIMLPKLRDNEWIIFNDYHECYLKRIIYPLFGARQIAKSEIETSLSLRELSLFKETEAMAIFSNSPDRDTFTKKLFTAVTHGETFMIIPPIDKDFSKDEIRWGFTRPDNTTDIRARLYIYNTQDGKKIQIGSGKSISFLLFDEIAKSPYKSVYDVIEPALLSDNGSLRCSPILAFTGGEVEKGKDAEDLVKNPSTNQFKMNYENSETGEVTEIGGRVLDGLYRKDCKAPMKFSDYIGKTTNTWLDNTIINVSNKTKALEKIQLERKEALKSTNPKSLVLKKIFFPLNLDDIFLTESNNKFNINAAKQQQEWLKNHYTPNYVELYRNLRNKVEWRFEDKLKPLSKFPITPADNKLAPICVYEFPIEDVPFGTYCIGCLPPGEKVMTDCGLMNIEDVTLDNKLISESGDLVSIKNLQTYEVNNEPIYEITVANTYRTTKYTKEHPILVSDQNNKYISNYKELGVKQLYKDFDFKFTRAEEIKKGQWIKVPNTYRKEFDIDNDLWNSIKIRKNFFIKSPLENKDFWWLMGLWLGDGYCVNTYLTISFNSKEEEYINKYETLCKSLFGGGVFSREKSGSIEVTIISKQLTTFINNNFGKYSYGKYIPEWVKYMKHEFKYELLRGYLNSDGCVHKDKREYLSTEFVSINLELLESFQDILLSLGYTSSITTLREKGVTAFKGKKESETKKTYHLRLCNSESIRLLMSIYDEKDHKINKVKTSISNNCKKRQTDCFFTDNLEYAYFKILDVKTSSYTGNVYNFECDTHTFMCNHITTHNCDPINNDDSNERIVSMASITVFKRMISPLDEFKDEIVCTWCGRFNSLEEFHELALMIAELYDAKKGVLPEASENTLIQYFFHKRKGIYLADSFELIKEFVPKFKGSASKKGLPATPRCQKHYMNLEIEATNSEEVIVDEEGNETQIIGISKIKDPMLLEEMINYKGKTFGQGVHDGNFDRIISYGCALTLAKHYDIVYPPSAFKPKEKTAQDIYNEKTSYNTMFGQVVSKRNNPFGSAPKKSGRSRLFG